MAVLSLWPMIGSGWACEPILANEMEQEVCWEALGKGFLTSKETTWKKMPLLLVLKIIMSGCDAWTYSSHFGAIRGAHVEAKPSTEGGRAGRENLGPQDPSEAVDCIIPRSGDVQYTILSLFHIVPVRVLLLAAQILVY